MRRGSVAAGLIVSAAVGLGLVYCINPVEEKPLKWASAIEVPINHKLMLGEEFGNLFSLDSSMKILNVDSTYVGNSTDLSRDTVTGNTVIFSVAQSDSIDLEVSEENFEDKVITHTLGIIPLSGIPDVTQSVPLAGNFPSGTTLPAVQQDISIPDVYSIQFADPSDPLTISITNNSNVALSNVIIDVAGVGNAAAASIPANGTSEITIDASGNTLTVPVTVSVTATTASAGPFNGGSDLQFSISLDGMSASSVDIANTLLASMNKTFLVTYELSDTVEMKYIDLRKGAFFYLIDNYTNLDFEIIGYHHHMWSTQYSMQNNIRSRSQLTAFGSLDSSFFRGRMPASSLAKMNVKAKTLNEYQNAVGSYRLFTEWSDPLSKSVSNVEYFVAPDVSTKKRVTISSTDSIVFTISSRDFQFSEFYGIVRKEIVRDADTQYVPIDFPWPEENKPLMRDKFVFEKVEARMNIKPVLYQHTKIDTFVTEIKMFDPTDPSVAAVATPKFCNVKNDTSYNYLIDITDVTNRFPDSITIVSRSLLPVGTPLLVVNDLETTDPEYFTHIGRTTIRVNAKYIMNADLDWAIVDSFPMDLGTDTFAMFDQARLVQKFEQRRAVYNMILYNNSNLNLRLFALIAPKAKMADLEALSILETHALVSQEGAADAAGYVNLLGSEGFFVPKRSTTDSVFNQIILEDAQIAKLISSDTCSWRWQIRFLEKTPHEALSDTDYVDMKSWLRVEGVNNSDSLLIW